MSGSASRAALETVRARIGEVSGRAATSGGLIDLASELYAIADLLASQPQLRRSVGDPATALGARADLIGGLLEGKVSAEARDLARAAAEQRWSTPWDLAEGMEHLGDDALLRAAEQDGDLDEVEDQLFRFERILDSQSQLTTLLDEISVPAPRRTALLRDVIAGRVHPITQALLEHAVASTRKRSVELAIDDLLEAAAARRHRSMARVVTAVELTSEQESRLTAALTDIYGRPIALRTAVDPAVRGGLAIRVGDEVIDGTISSRLAAARAALTS
ncbi:MAG TPA: F0F1 ATP synthase subunit delta [Jatrophihabitantaceae bacterium]|nr:F0F1 ATP synthase subunit delta [Jatrophihabitantaceae bacterium]